MFVKEKWYKFLDKLRQFRASSAENPGKCLLLISVFTTQIDTISTCMLIHGVILQEVNTLPNSTQVKIWYFLDDFLEILCCYDPDILF